MSLLTTELLPESLPESTAPSPPTHGELPLALRPVKWFVLVRPHRPRTKIGSIALTQADQQAQSVFNDVGQILALGGLVGKAITTSGLRFAEDPDQLEVGQWVTYPKHCGSEHALNDVIVDGDGVAQLDVLKTIKETDVLAIVTDPSRLWVWIAGN